MTHLEPITIVDCKTYHEDPYVCDDIGEPKGQCINCGAKWYEHALDVLPNDEQYSALLIQAWRGIKP